MTGKFLWVCMGFGGGGCIFFFALGDWLWSIVRMGYMDYMGSISYMGNRLVVPGIPEKGCAFRVTIAAAAAVLALTALACAVMCVALSAFGTQP